MSSITPCSTAPHVNRPDTNEPLNITALPDLRDVGVAVGDCALHSHGQVLVVEEVPGAREIAGVQVQVAVTKWSYV